MERLGKLTLTIGFQGKDGRQKYPTGINVATVALYNEFGTDGHGGGRGANLGIPARSFLRGTLFERRHDIETEMATSLGAIVNGRTTPIAGLSDVGQKVARMVTEKIRGSRGWAKGNAASTIKNKGFDWPLHETLKLRDSVSWAVRKGSAKGSIIAQGSA